MRLEEKIKYAKSITDRKKRAAYVRPLIERHEKNFGKVGDRIISKKWGVGITLIGVIRRGMGIDAFRQPPPLMEKTPERIALEKDPDL